ncbi:host-nuclease inhibitor Gam family protein [Fretibacterium fastidiosum]|uniref:Bacteriophage Mu Gam like protein n=1 Tax=Fretibacterium fastidiosum TaxID=651822 RepID=A0AB94IY51_9BACT|nr:host-nuclease inhibitor Gam family protein [Fretibacterium fastidiosum]CBL28594.1 Bacteriophage Mu Gam like protein [Fretibacterium fastidiosum]
MAREKPKQIIAPIRDLTEADNALAEIAEIDRAVAAANQQLNEDIDALKKNTQDEIAPLLERKSRDLGFGTIGFRKSTSLATLKKICSTWKEVLGKLKEYGFRDAIRVKEEPDKEAMSEWPKERLELVGVQRVEKDEFYYEISQEKLAEN